MKRYTSYIDANKFLFIITVVMHKGILPKVPAIPIGKNKYLPLSQESSSLVEF